MKFISPTCILLGVLLGAFAASASAMKMNNMLMNQTLEDFLSQFVTFGDMTLKQKRAIVLMADDPSERFDRNEVFATEESKQNLRDYLYSEVSSNKLEEEVAEQIASTLMLGEMYPSSSTADLVESLMLNGPAPAVYNTGGEGNMVRLGKYTGMIGSTSSNYFHNGIWGYATGEFAILRQQLLLLFSIGTLI